MNCETAERHLRAYIDYELDAGLKAALAGHLSGCPACAQKLTLLKDTKALFQALGPITTTADFEPRLEKKLGGLNMATGTRPFTGLFWGKFLPHKGPVMAPAAAGLAAVLVLAVVLAVNFRNRPSVDSIVESYFTGRGPYYQALIYKHDLPANDSMAAGADRRAWSTAQAGRELFPAKRH